MPSFRSERRVRHSAEEMFDLVADVENYPEFVPLCRALRVRRRSGDEQGVEVLVAEMEVGHRAIHEKFTTRVTPKITVSPAATRNSEDAPASPVSSWISRAVMVCLHTASLRAAAWRRGNPERPESRGRLWVASSQALLAMTTATGRSSAPPADMKI